MEKEQAGFGLDRIRETDMVAYLETLGCEVAEVRKQGTDYWYLSPLRNERTASFHVNTLTNEWYDFAEQVGGNMVDFCLRFYGCGIPELLDKFNLSFSPHRLPLFDRSLHEGLAGEGAKLVVTDVRSLYLYPLKNYLHERMIPVAVAGLFCKEVHYQIGGRSYYGIGFKNDAGGWEIRNKNYKQSSAPKDITSISNGSGSVQVFEGFFDFLSYRTLHPGEDIRACDFVVLNGAGLFDRALPFLDQHSEVRLWLDRDVTGRRYTEYALSLGERYSDESSFYHQHKDLNDWLQHKGEAPKQQLAVKNRLVPG